MINYCSLPPSWSVAKLGDECLNIIGGGTPSRQTPEYFGGNIIWLTPTEIDKNSIKIISDSKEKITELGLQKSSAKIIRKGAVLLTSRASIGYVAIAGCDVTTNQGFASFECEEKLFNKYLAYWLVYKRELLNELATGTTFKEISKSVLRKLEISFPPLPEQHRIVEKIEELFSELDASVAVLKRAKEQIKTYKQSVLKHAFEGKLIIENGQLIINEETGLPEGWKWVKVGDICDCIVPNRDKPKSFSGNIYWVTIPDLHDGSISINYSLIDKGLTLKETNDYKAKIIPVNSVIMSCVGRFGITAVIEKECVINQQLHAFLPSENISPKYLAYALKSQKSYMEQNSTATTIAYLNKTNCNNIPVPLSPLSEQNRIVEEIEKRFSEAENLEKTINTALQQAESLRQSILKKAFEGGLVENSEL